MCSEIFIAERPTVRGSRGGGGGGGHGFGVSPGSAAVPLPRAPRPASFPVTARAPSSQAAPRHRESPAEGTACAKAGLALGEDGAFPEQMKSSKTLSCQFEESLRILQVFRVLELGLI